MSVSKIPQEINPMLLGAMFQSLFGAQFERKSEPVKSPRRGGDSVEFSARALALSAQSDVRVAVLDDVVGYTREGKALH